MLTPAHVELYCRVRSDPFRRAGFRIDEAVIFCERVERGLAKLDDIGQLAVVLQGMGYTQAEIAERAGISLRTASRRMPLANATMFAELGREWGGKVRIHRSRRRKSDAVRTPRLTADARTSLESGGNGTLLQ